MKLKIHNQSLTESPTAEPIGTDHYRNRSITLSRTTGGRTRKKQSHTAINAKAMNLSMILSSSSRTLVTGQTTSTQERGRQAHGTLCLSNQRKTTQGWKKGPRHTVSINPKVTSVGWGRQAQGTLCLSTKLVSSCQVSKTPQGQCKQGSWAIQQTGQSS